MGFLFTLKWSLVVKAPDLSSPKCLVVTDFFFFFFKCSIFHYFFFFPFELGYLLLPSAVHLHPPRFPSPAGAEPRFLLGESQAMLYYYYFFFQRLFGAGWWQPVDGSMRGDRAEFGVLHHSAPQRQEHPAPPHPLPRCTQGCCCCQRLPRYDFRLFRKKKKKVLSCKDIVFPLFS